jgi:hypothetical protein
VRPFRYWRDPLFLACCLLYLANQVLLKSSSHDPFLRCWFNDALLIPCALPLVLRVHAWMGWREAGQVPSGGEIVAHLAGWSLLFEFIGPGLLLRGTGDKWDVMAYTAGAIGAYVWWHREKLWPLAVRTS